MDRGVLLVMLLDVKRLWHAEKNTHMTKKRLPSDRKIGMVQIEALVCTVIYTV